MQVIPVSYTHLDVRINVENKMQDEVNKSIKECDNAKTEYLARKDQLDKEKDKIIPVSYTHLDVYKRQVKNDEQDAFDNMSVGLQCSERGSKMEDYIELMEDAGDQIDNAVSYTHLINI